MPSLESYVEKMIKRETDALRREIQSLRRALRSGRVAGAAASGGRANVGSRGGRRQAGTLTAAQVKGMRAKLGMSQAAFAKMAGVTPVAVYFWESGRTTPSIEKEKILLKANAKAGGAKPAAAKASGSKRGKKR